jgi:hypothetical protein
VGGDCDGDCALAPEPRGGLGATIGRKGIAEGRASMGHDGMAWPTMAHDGPRWGSRVGEAFGPEIFALALRCRGRR